LKNIKAASDARHRIQHPFHANKSFEGNPVGVARVAAHGGLHL
jgi:hypothetical protein